MNRVTKVREKRWLFGKEIKKIQNDKVKKVTVKVKRMTKTVATSKQ
jgi:hypothetical protein